MKGKIGRYTILEQIGEGTMGNVYRAKDETLDDIVALKLLHRRHIDNPHIRERFLREGHLISTLHHPAIVPIYHIDEIGEQVYLVMPLMEGGSLSQRQARHHTFSPAEIASLIKRIADALDAIHAENIIHRDVKPQNILFDSDNKPYLADFSIVKNNRDPSGLSTQVGQRLGTPTYMSPELIVCPEEIDSRSDLYALGIVLFELLAGQAPYSGSNVLAAHLTHAVPSLQEFDHTVSTHWQDVVNKAMHKDPDQRYQSGAALSVAVDEVARLLQPPDSMPMPSVKSIEPQPRSNTDTLRELHQILKQPDLTDSNAIQPSPRSAPLPTANNQNAAPSNNSPDRMLIWVRGMIAVIVLIACFLISLIIYQNRAVDPESIPTSTSTMSPSTSTVEPTQTATVTSMPTPVTTSVVDVEGADCTNPGNYELALDAPRYRPSRNTVNVSVANNPTLIFEIQVNGSCVLAQNELTLTGSAGPMPLIQLLDVDEMAVEVLTSGDEGYLTLTFADPADTLDVDLEWAVGLDGEDGPRWTLSLNTNDEPWLISDITLTPTPPPTIVSKQPPVTETRPPTNTPDWNATETARASQPPTNTPSPTQPPTNTPPPTWTPSPVSTSTPTATATLTCLQQAAADPEGDLDGDGKLNKYELVERLDPCDPDSDGDGLIDGIDICPDTAGSPGGNGCPNTGTGPADGRGDDENSDNSVVTSIPGPRDE